MGYWGTCSVITRKIVDLLGLIPTGFVEVHTANGTAIQRTFIIDIKLPNGMLVKGIPAIEVYTLSGDSEALIGMDIITLGDLSITNYNGHICMSFRIPSLHEIDFFESPNFGG